MVAQRPQIAARDACCRLRFLQCRVQVERFRPIPLLASVQALEQACELVLAEAGEPEVDLLHGGEVRQHPRQQLVVPVAGDLVQGQVEQARLLQGQIHVDHRDSLKAQLPRRDQALVAADDGAVLPPGDDGVDQAELLDAARERLQLLVRDPARVGWVGTQVADGDVLDAEFGWGRLAQEKSPLSIGATVGTLSALGGGHGGHGSRLRLLYRTCPSVWYYL